MGTSVNRLVAATAVAWVLNIASSLPALAWGDEGHEVIALIAQTHLDPTALKKVSALLAADTDSLTSHDIAAEATWADKLRNSNDNGARQKTRQWHYVDIEISAPDIDYACFGHPFLSSGELASNGPEADCVVDKIQQFAAELASPATNPEEQIVALKFLLHFVGDIHQPLHAADDNDRGGNEKRVAATGFRAGNLHHFWDTEFVRRLGPDAAAIASDLNRRISASDVQRWSQGGAADWALETFTIGRDDAYGQLPEPSGRGIFVLSDDYVAMADRDVASQLSKAGIRLAYILNKTLGTMPIGKMSTRSP
jgi:hypothetical protein